MAIFARSFSPNLKSPSFVRNKVWKHSPHNSFKVNVDAAFVEDRGLAFIATVIRDHKGSMMTGTRCKILCSVLAEAIVLQEGIYLASSYSYDKIILESDNLDVVEARRSRDQRGALSIVVDDILAVRSNFSSCSFVWTSRESNQAAHPKLGLEGNLCCDWVVSRPISLQRLVNVDKKGYLPQLCIGLCPNCGLFGLFSCFLPLVSWASIFQ